MAAKKKRQKKKRMGRPPLPDADRRVTYTVRVPRRLLIQFRRAARGVGRGVATAVIEKAMADYLTRIGRKR